MRGEIKKLSYFSGWINDRIIKTHGVHLLDMWKKAAEKAAYNGRELVIFEVPKEDGHIITPLIYDVERLLSEKDKQCLTVGNMFEKL